MIVLKIFVESNLYDVWNSWNNPEDIIKWYQGHEDWITTKASNPLMVGKSFSYKMMSNDLQSSFTLNGRYLAIDEFKIIRYVMDDKRKVETIFQEVKNEVMIIQRVEMEKGNSTESQATWWRSILLNFKKHTEAK